MTNDKTKISPNRQKKETIVAELSEKVNKSKAMVFTNYEGMTHQQLEELKKALRKADAEVVVAKNTLIIRSLKKDSKSFDTLDTPDTLDTLLVGPTATLFAYSDVVLPLKELARTIKSLKLPVIKFGILDGRAITASDVTKLATLPSREVLIAQVVGGMKSPIFGLHRALNWNIQKFVMTLGAIQKGKS